MICPYCLYSETKVIDKRDVSGITKRRRECLKCKKRFNTRESLEEISLSVIKKDNRREDFDRDKIRRGVMKACEKRPVSEESINKILANIEDKIRKMGKEVKSTVIGELVSRELKKADKVAYIRFASVYRDFADLDDFKKEIRGLVKK
ncbi:MAG: transcriptional regulator NrdR [Nanoarchaeota archaeon]